MSFIANTLTVPHDFSLVNTFGWNPMYDRSRESGQYYTNYIESQRVFVRYANITNILGYFVAPLMGLIRIIVSASLLRTDNSQKRRKSFHEQVVHVINRNNRKWYLCAQIGRGVFELLGGGHLLFFPDLLVTSIRAYNQEYPFLTKPSNGTVYLEDDEIA